MSGCCRCMAHCLPPSRCAPPSHTRRKPRDPDPNLEPNPDPNLEPNPDPNLEPNPEPSLSLT